MLIWSIRKANGHPEVAMPATTSSDVASQSSNVPGLSHSPYLSKLNDGTFLWNLLSDLKLSSKY